MKTTILISTFFILTSACQAKTSSQSESCQLETLTSYASPMEADYQKLVMDLNGYNLGDDTFGRPSWLSPNSILPRVHPWFQNGKTFCQEPYSRTVKIAPLPDRVILDLMALSKANHHGIGILNGKFWKDIQFIQKQGLNTSFIDNPKGQKIGGFFSHTSNMIAFDILANPGTTRHELRHYKQHLNEPGISFSYEKYFVLGIECTENAARFFGELDANAYQMRDWIGTFEFDKLINNQSIQELHFPQAELFSGYLNYPYLASQWLKKDCDGGFLKIIDEIILKTGAFHKKAGNISYQIQGLATGYISDQQEYNISCNKNSESALCKKIVSNMQTFPERINSLKLKLYQALEKEAKERPEYIKQDLKKLSPEIIKVLSQESGGFKFLLESMGYSK